MLVFNQQREFKLIAFVNSRNIVNIFPGGGVKSLIVYNVNQFVTGNLNTATLAKYGVSDKS